MFVGVQFCLAVEVTIIFFLFFYFCFCVRLIPGHVPTQAPFPFLFYHALGLSLVPDLTGGGEDQSCSLQ